jgi:deoxyadenosine/deoxycytidine kinase
MTGLNIHITGNIASGKSTLGRLASERIPNACFVSEPYETNPFLPLYLQDQPRWGFTSTLHYFWDYVRHYANSTANTSCAYYFVDAGTWTNRLIYGEYLYHEQLITGDEFSFYKTLCDLIERAYHHPQPDGFIFIHASPRTCWERMHQRGWAYQTTTIQPAYIERLDHYFELMKQEIKGRTTPMIELSSEDTDFTTAKGQQEAIGALERFLERYERPHP